MSLQRPLFDAIVVGLGATGGATCYHLARTGARVLGIDRFAPPHARGSSHGHTRIYRQAYYEAPAYVPLAVRALELWHELEREVQRPLFANTGGLTIGAEDGELFSGALRSARQHGIAHEVLSPGETTRRFPAFAPPRDTVTLFEPTAGVLFVDACVEAHLGLARKHDAVLQTDEQVVSIAQRGSAVRVMTARGEYEAARVVVAAGAWTPRLLGLEGAFRVTRETVHWFTPSSAAARAEQCPVSMIEYTNGPILYTIPDFGGGFKAGLHHSGAEMDPENTAASTLNGEAVHVAAAVRQFVPGGAGPLLSSAPCFYTTTDDHHFALGQLPGSPGVILASACSGHGFKFAAALGESLAQMARGEQSTLALEIFAPARICGG